MPGITLDTAQHSTAQHSTAQHSTAQHSTAQHSTAQHSTAQHNTAQASPDDKVHHSPAQHSIARVCYKIDLDELSFSQHLVDGRQTWGVHNVQVCLQVTSGQVASLSPHLGYLIPAQVVRAGSTCTCRLSISIRAYRVCSETPDRHKDCGIPASSPHWWRGETIGCCEMLCISPDGLDKVCL